MVRLREVIKFQSFEFHVSDVIPVNVENIPLLVLFPFFVSFIKKKPPTKFKSVLEHFSRAYEVVKF